MKIKLLLETFADFDECIFRLRAFGTSLVLMKCGFGSRLPGFYDHMRTMLTRMACAAIISRDDGLSKSIGLPFGNKKITRREAAEVAALLTASVSIEELVEQPFP